MGYRAAKLPSVPAAWRRQQTKRAIIEDVTDFFDRPPFLEFMLASRCLYVHLAIGGSMRASELRSPCMVGLAVVICAPQARTSLAHVRPLRGVRCFSSCLAPRGAIRGAP